MTREEKYSDWVNRVTSFLSDAGPKLGEKGTHCATFQSKPVLDKRPDVVFLGYNPNEPGEFKKDDLLAERFYDGNPYFYSSERKKWKVWRLADAFKWAEYESPVTDGNFVFFNAVYFGSKNIESFKRILGSVEAIETCLAFTKEVIQDIFQPKCIVCFSVKDCFNLLNKRFIFRDIETIDTAISTDPGLIEFAKSKAKGAWKSTYSCSQPIMKGQWDNIPVYGIPHPSNWRLTRDDLGAIALYLRSELQKLLLH